MTLADLYFEWLHGTPFDLAVTVDANQYLAPGRRLGIFQAIDQRLNREFLGPRHSYLPESRRVRIVGVTEEELSTVAFWLALAIPVDDTAPVKKTRAERALMALFHERESSPAHLSKLMCTAQIRGCSASASASTHTLNPMSEALSGHAIAAEHFRVPQRALLGCFIRRPTGADNL